MKRLIFVLLFVTGLCSATFAQENKLSLQETVAGFEQAMIKKDTAILRSVVDENFSLSTTTWPASARLMQTVFTRNAECESISLVSEKPESSGNKQKITVRIKEAGKDAFESDVYLNSDNKILYVDYLDQLFGKFRYQESRLLAKVPFVVEPNGSIILTIRLNNNSRELHFLFDSAADGMATSKDLAESLGLEVTRNQSTSVVGGSMNVSISSGNTVSLDTLKLTNQNIAIFEKMRDGIDGLIGMNILKNFIAKFDIDNQTLSLYNFGNYQYEKEGETVAIITPGNIALIPAALDLTGMGYVKGNFAFDTGAAYHLIGFSSFVRKNKLLTGVGFKPEFQTSTSSMGKVTPTFNGHCQDFVVGNIHFKNMPVALQAGSSWNAGADGSLGIGYSSRYNFTINLLNKEIHLTPGKFVPEEKTRPE